MTSSNLHGPKTRHQWSPIKPPIFFQIEWRFKNFKLKVQKWKIRINRIGGFDGEQVTGDISDLYPHQAKMAEIIPPPNILLLTFDERFESEIGGNIEPNRSST